MSNDCVLYVRYSSDNQKETSIDDQIKLGKEAIDRRGWRFTIAYSDYAVSGASMQRNGLQSLMDDAAKGRFSIVVTEGLDRLSRDQEDMAGIYKRLTFYGVRIYSLTDGGFVSDIHVAFGGVKNAQFLKDLSYKVHRGMRGHIESGKAVTKSYGYDIVRRFDANGEPVRGERTINENEAVIIRRIFEEYSKGQSARKIAKALNKEGIPSPKNTLWGETTINGSRKDGKGIINNTLYMGQLVWNKFSYRKHPDTEKSIGTLNDEKDWVVSDVPELRIIDQDLWDKVKARQNALATNSYAHLKRRPKYLLSYLLRCGACGGGYSKISVNRYGCTTARKQGTCDNRRTINRHKLEDAALNALEHQLMHPELLEVFVDEYNAHIERLSQQQGQSKQYIEKQLQKLNTDKTKLIEAIKHGIPADELKEEFNRLARQREHLSQQLEQSDTKPQIITLDLGQRYQYQIKNLRSLLNDEEQAEEAIDVIRPTIDKIILSPNPVTNKLTATLHGDLAGMLNVGAQNDTLSLIDTGLLSEFTKKQETNTAGHSLCLV